ncbi:DMT family transporter [Chamaesiphon polymorphus]|uniref:EamA family transporter n=1 Tax=Chamaesiphon polymorphus CCALA 037 TaxID=2107692 RepID=A0A2T1GNE2_9CYAN|nr:DMT family transporter [Chamaesiphon polymorphus]PSB59434.1 EamA family transporter [Chamaesiphon polymorphus CCALA 037]
MMPTFPQQLTNLTSRIPGYIYLWLAIPIFGSSSALTRKITEIGAQHFVDGHNPISYCNVLFTGNLCALLVLVAIHRHQWSRNTWRQISGREWMGLVIVAILAGALAPGLIFQALSLTPVTNVLLLGRLEPPLTLALSIWLLRERLNRWEVLGSIVAFTGVVLTIVLQTDTPVDGFQVGVGELMAVSGAIFLSIATIVAKKYLTQVPLGIHNTVRTGLGTIVYFGLALWMYGFDHFMGVLSPFLWQWMLLYGTVIVVIGQSLWNIGFRNSSIATASLVSSFAPIVGILAAYLILGEVPTEAQYIGGIVILLGLFLGQVGMRAKTDRLKSIGVNSIETEQEIEGKMGFRGI